MFVTQKVAKRAAAKIAICITFLRNTQPIVCRLGESIGKYLKRLTEQRD